MEQTDVKNILGLHLPTDPRWVDLASISLQEILTDHGATPNSLQGAVKPAAARLKRSFNL